MARYFLLENQYQEDFRWIPRLLIDYRYSLALRHKQVSRVSNRYTAYGRLLNAALEYGACHMLSSAPSTRSGIRFVL